ncbi:MAG: acyl--CoA ligase [Rhodospirillaceae bacterium]|nr:acyl--CoA ligase [Rhodospirillaceae bacterium]
MDIGTLIPRHAQYRPDHTAIVFDGNRLTYAAFNQRINKLANALLAGGITKGQMVATVMPNCQELLDIYWAAAKTGIVVVPMSPLLQPKGLAKLLNDADAVMVFVHPNYAPLVDASRDGLDIPSDKIVLTGEDHSDRFRRYEDFVSDAPSDDPPDAALSDDDIYNIIYSSGTIGDPKGIVHTHYVRANYCTMFSQAFRMSPESILLQTGAAIFNGAFVLSLPLFYNGGTYILHEAFDMDRVIETVRDEGVTHIMMVPAQIIQLIDHPELDPDDLKSLECVLSLGAPLHLEHKKRFDALLPGRFYELYGLTEGFMTILDKNDFPRKPESVGACPPFLEMRIRDDNGSNLPANEIGEIVGRGPHLMPGYYKRPDLTAEAIKEGWLYSGDLGYMDEDGFLYLVDRKKEMIISGGVNVYPRDIEDVAVAHPDVSEVAVFGLPDEKWGETPICAVVLKTDASVAEETLKDWINANVAAKFQRVSRVLIMDDFPRNAAGKTLKRAIRDGLLP